MDLKFRRNLPLLMLFVGLVIVLMFGLGHQPIIAYTIENTQAGENSQVTEGALVVDAAAPTDSSSAVNGEVSAPAEADMVLTPEATQVPDDTTAIDSSGVSSALLQTDQG